MKHTPLPWNRFGNERLGYGIFSGDTTVVNLSCVGGDNARFIERACNCHKELLEACKLALREFECVTPETFYAKEVAILRAAIAKATA